MRKILLAPLIRFIRDERGTVLAEFVIMIPLLLWAWIAMYMFWDAYRALNAAQKATYAISDMLSREQTAVTNSYRDGLRNVFAYMAGKPPSQVKTRFTSITYSTARNRFEVHWSYSPGSQLTKLNTATLQDLADRIPAMSDGDYVLLVQTSVSYKPPVQIDFFGTYMQARNIENFVLTRPRFMRVCESGQTCS